MSEFTACDPNDANPVMYYNAKLMLRDRFSMAALTGMCGRPVVMDENILAQQCYIVADAMLKARS